MSIEVVVGSDLEGHAGMRREEAGHDRRQHLHRHDHRHVEPERPARARSRKPLTTSSPLSISLERRARAVRAGAAPASVGGDAAGRAVEAGARRASASSRRTASLKPEADPPRATAAPRKPRARATATKASRSARLGVGIPEFYAPGRRDASEPRAWMPAFAGMTGRA